MNGRYNLEGYSFDINITSGDTATEVNAKIVAAINGVLMASVTAAVVTVTTSLTAKWAGLTSDDINVTIDNYGDTGGITYLIAVSYTHLTLPTIHVECRSRWSPYH